MSMADPYPRNFHFQRKPHRIWVRNVRNYETLCRMSTSVFVVFRAISSSINVGLSAVTKRYNAMKCNIMQWIIEIIQCNAMQWVYKAFISTGLLKSVKQLHYSWHNSYLLVLCGKYLQIARGSSNSSSLATWPIQHTNDEVETPRPLQGAW